MDSERQCLLTPSVSYDTYDKYRPLRHDEVLRARRELPWRAARVCLILCFWTALAILLSIIASLLTTHKCSKDDLGPAPSVPPVHMSFGPLISEVTS